MGVVVDGYGIFEPDAANNDLDQEWGPKDFVRYEETKDDELWDKKDEVCVDAELIKWRLGRSRERHIKSIYANRNPYRCSRCNQHGHNKCASPTYSYKSGSDANKHGGSIRGIDR